MRYTEIEGMQISKIILGTTYYGSDLSEEISFDLMDTYLSLGGNCIDTARAYNIYSGPQGADCSERCIGRYLASRRCRERVLISTKGGHNLSNGEKPRLDRPTLNSDLERSLELLGTEHTDLYWLHRDDPERPVGELLETVEDFRERGLVRTVGASNWTVARMEEAEKYAASHGLHGFSAAQIQWSLAVTEPSRLNDPTLVCMNRKEMEWLSARNLPVFAFSSQAKGYFSKLLSGAELNDKLKSRYDTEENRATAERVRMVCDDYGINPTAAALHFVLDNRLPACAIVGCSSVEQLKDSMASSDLTLSPETVEYLRRLI